MGAASTTTQSDAKRRFPVSDQATWDRTNGGTFPKVGEGGQRCRVDGELAVVRNGLDHKEPGVCAAKPATDRTISFLNFSQY
jgi:hypothetical protein